MYIMRRLPGDERGARRCDQAFSTDPRTAVARRRTWGLPTYVTTFKEKGGGSDVLVAGGFVLPFFAFFHGRPSPRCKLHAPSASMK